MADRDIGRWVAEISTGYRVKGSVYCLIGDSGSSEIWEISGLSGDRRYRGIGTPCAPTIQMTPQELRERTRQFMLRVIRFCRTLPTTTEGQEIGRQLIRAGMGTADNYRSSQRARSRTEFASRLSLALDEADEAHSWLTAACDLAIGDQVEAEVPKTGSCRTLRYLRTRLPDCETGQTVHGSMTRYPDNLIAR
jgi:four helix bundle protein